MRGDKYTTRANAFQQKRRDRINERLKYDDVASSIL